MADTLALPYFGYTSVEVFEPLDNADARRAIDAFLLNVASHAEADSRHVHAYYRDFHAAVGGEDWLDDQMGIPATPADIWDHVQPQGIFVEINPDDGLPYVVVEANCDWEEEHGLMMVWREGKVLVKVGGYDGHLTNERAYADPSLRNVVYRASNPALTTRRTNEP